MSDDDLRTSEPPPGDAYARFLGAAIRDPERIAGRHTAHLRQRGAMRMKPGSRWLPFTATQTIAAAETSFEWVARFKLLPAVWLQVIDRCERGRGELLVKPWNRIRLARLRGRDADIGEVLRYLAELVWCPMALASNPDIRHESVGADRVDVSALSHGEPRTVELHLDERGRVQRIWCERRPMAQGKRVVERPWFGTVLGYREYAGLAVPAQMEVGWMLDGEPFVYFRCSITEFAIE
jgi:hypothetical protein